MNDTRNASSTNDPDVIYHYTTISGLKGIIENKNIWATNINYLNDWREFREFVTPFLERFQDQTTHQFLDNIFRMNSKLVYVCSFSAKKDDLSQWRGYSPRANGFSIGFNRSKLRNLLPEGELFELKKCEYDPRQRETEIQTIIDNTVRDNAPDPPNLTTIISKITVLAPYRKNSAFRDEDEWRMVKFVKDEEVKFREAKTLIVPYTEIDLTNKDGNLPIETIFVGPTPYMAESKLSLELFLIKNGLSNVLVRGSDIPYREL